MNTITTTISPAEVWAMRIILPHRLNVTEFDLRTIVSEGAIDFLAVQPDLPKPTELYPEPSWDSRVFRDFLRNHAAMTELYEQHKKDRSPEAEAHRKRIKQRALRNSCWPDVQRGAGV